jgi:beta-xylosidase
MPTIGNWSDGVNVWAPSVIKRADGKFVLYYAAADANAPALHCVGAAISNSVTGPYVPQNTSLACPLSSGGAIDPAGFIDTDGSHYVVYKVDGNSIGNGGTCGNTVEPIVPTPLMLQKLGTDAMTPMNDPVELLDRGDQDGPLIEAPSLIRMSDGTYVLFFSSNCYSTTLYDVSYATASSLTGPYTKSSTPLLVTGSYNLTAPGGATATTNGQGFVFHANCDAGRCMHYLNLNVGLGLVATN